MSTGDHAYYQQSWLHLMGAVDELLEEARANAGQLEPADPALVKRIAEAGRERAAAEAAFQGFMERRERLMHMLDQIQGELAVAGLPLKGDII
jgi:hypothetical protein